MAKDPILRIADKFTIGDGCWEWTASKVSGYGQFFRPGGGNPVRAHVYMYELLVGPIPAGMQLDHLCRNRACIRPDHLEPVTQAENLRRKPKGLDAAAGRLGACRRWHGDRRCCA